MSSKLRLVTICLFLTGLTVTVLLLADGRASQETVQLAAETSTEEADVDTEAATVKEDDTDNEDEDVDIDLDDD